MTHSRRFLNLILLAVTSAGLGACSNQDDDSVDLEAQATLDVKAYVAGELDGLVAAAEALQAAAPDADADGWNPTDDAEAVDAMREAWGDARDAYERVEGAIAVLFPNLDVSTDERYDGFIEEVTDDDPFDAEGVTGMHAIERILWADSHPQRVIDFEAELPGYAPAAFPSNEAEAAAFTDELCQRLVDDVTRMRDDFEPLALDPATAFRGVIGSMEEQLEKVTLAATAEDESRYAQRTLDDMRANLEGGRESYAAFQAWVREAAGEDTDAEILAGFELVADAYAEYSGSAIPEVPAGFDPDDPSEEHLATTYGQLWQLLSEQADPASAASLVGNMLEAADSMGIPALPQ